MPTYMAICLKRKFAGSSGKDKEQVLFRVIVLQINDACITKRGSDDASVCNLSGRLFRVVLHAELHTISLSDRRGHVR